MIDSLELGDRQRLVLRTAVNGPVLYGGVGEEEPQSPPILIDRGVWYGTAPAALAETRVQIAFASRDCLRLCTARFTARKNYGLKSGN
jgi:hypothetical protein